MEEEYKMGNENSNSNGQYRHDLAIAAVMPNPENPRKTFDQGALEELAESIRQKGVIQPVLVRPLNGSGGYQLVAGERRYRASILAGMESIPAVIRELDDRETLEIMTIENLQREDLSELEEAESFRRYLDGLGEDALPGLAERVGVSAAYVRKRVKVLELPKEVLNAWQEGKIVYGHLEQFLRCKDEEDILSMFRTVARGYGPVSTVAELRSQIDSRAPDLHSALFDTSECGVCRHNGAVQLGLFGDLAEDREKTKCHNAECFQAKLEQHLLAALQSGDFRKAYQTNGFRVDVFLPYTSFENMEYVKKLPKKECEDCADRVSFFRPDGRIWCKNACMRPMCFRTATAQRAGKDDGKKTELIAREYRETFYRKTIAKTLAGAPLEDYRIKKVLLATLLRYEGSSAYRELRKRCPDLPDQSWPTWDHTIWARVMELRSADLDSILAAVGTSFASASNFGEREHHMLAPMIGIDLAKEWKITEGYLKAHTIAQILVIAKELKLLDEEKVKKYAQEKFGAKKFESLKKEQLIEALLKSKVPLAGRVPKEVLEVK